MWIIGNPSTPLSELQWTSMDEPNWMLDSYSLKPLAPPPHHGTDPEELSHQDYALVVTGDVFRWMINHAPLETLQRVGVLCRSCGFWASCPGYRCLSGPRSSPGCHQMRRTKWWKGYSHWGTRC